jgi:hypothetical protein
VTTIDFFEKEVRRLQERFNATFGQAKTVNMMARSLTIMAICRAGILVRSVRETEDEQKIGVMTRDFCRIREVINGLFDRIESEQERRGHGQTTDKRSIAAGG